MSAPAIKALHRVALAHARKQAPAQSQDHEDAVGQALLEAVESGSYDAQRICRRVRTLLRAARPDRRRASQSVLVEAAFREDDPRRVEPSNLEAPGEALDRVAADSPLWQSAPDKPERLPPATRMLVSHLRAEFENELIVFWHPAGLLPNWRSWARRIARVTQRAADPDRVAAAMGAGYLAPRGRQRKAPDLGGPVLLDGQPLPDMELATRQVGALFKLCGIDLADTREHDARLATAVGRFIRGLAATDES